MRIVSQPEKSRARCYRGTSLIRNTHPPGVNWMVGQPACGRAGAPPAPATAASIFFVFSPWRVDLEPISHRCHPNLVAFVWELTKETINLPLGCLQGVFPAHTP